MNHIVCKSLMKNRQCQFLLAAFILGTRNLTYLFSREGFKEELIQNDEGAIQGVILILGPIKGMILWELGLDELALPCRNRCHPYG